MELLKKNIHMNRRKGRTVSQVSLDADQNVPDSKADIEKIIQEKSEVHVEEVRPAADHVMIRGAVVYDLLYMDNEKEHRIHSMQGKAYFDESVHIDGISARDHVCVEWEYESPHVTIINSRKVNFRTILTFFVPLDEIYDEEVTVDVTGNPYLQRRNKKVSLLQMKVNKKDVMRIRNQWQLSQERACIEEVLFYTITPKGVRVALRENQLLATGELAVFLLYVPEGENALPQWLEYSVHFEDNAECGDAREDMIGDLHWEIGTSALEIRPDNDGEQRIVSVECVLELSVKLYEEETVDNVTDVYATDKELVPIRKEVLFSKLLVKNESRCRTTKRMKVTDAQARVLQICHSEGTVKLEDTVPVENGLKVSGTLWVQLLYITSDDVQPFRLAKGTIPFSHVIDAQGISDTCIWHIYPVIEQLSADMIDSEEMEIRADINMDTIVFDKQPETVIDRIEEKEPDLQKLQELPGIVGYVVKEQDDLWEIAKKYFTTTQALMEINGLTEEQIVPGTKLIILKSVMENISQDGSKP